MMQKLKSLLMKEYVVEITWDKGKKEIVPIKAWNKMNALNKVAKKKDYFYYDPHAEMTKCEIRRRNYD
ncbi:hypothetical protein [Virgibacillus sp. Bac332]|uniref:hypothetical protein n=1 Tax=Virgibacillus sp. Bac332 TaxID=2419842 RepID=UPI000EF44004|nr:hypothetical protein [Virgibacillus sp. Bac332]